MKKYVKVLLSCCCLFLIVLACTKEVGLITEVEFELLEQHTAEGYVNQGLPTTFTVLPEEILENYEYNITYEILDGDGYFEDIDGNRLKAGVGQSVPTTLTSSLMYMGAETGEHRVKITGTDNFGLSQEIEVTYDLSDVPVIWEASSELTELERETPVDLSLLFETLDGALDVDYEAMFGFNSGSGSLEPSEENGYVLSGEYNSIVPGTSPFVFTPSELGPQQLVFTLRDSNGQEIEALLDFNVVEFIDVISISLVSQDTIKMKLGDEIPPAFTFDPPNATDQGVTVVSSDPDVVFIDENNVCIAVGLGTAVVTVTSVSNPEASDTVTVVVIEADRIPVTGITVSQENPGATGTERQLLAAVLPEDATDPSVTWSSSDDTIASIDENGLLTGLSAGTATITATSVSDPDIKGVVQIEITGVSLLSANSIETFALKDQIETATIDPVTHTVSITVLEGTPLNVAPIMLTVSEGATIAPGLLQARDFSSPVEYTVTSGNGTEQVWTVNAKVLTIPVAGETNITGFELAGQNSSTINTTDRTVTVNVPDGTELNVAPQILEVSPDATVAPAIGQVQDFSEAVTYTVTPETGTPQVWTVNVTVSAPPGSDQNAITAFELLGQTDVAIDNTAGTITVTVPNGTNLSAAPSVLNVSENATVNPAIGDVQDFSGAVTYTVTAENTDERVWTVNVNVTSSSNKSIDSFMVNEVSGTFNGTDISLTLPFGTDVTALSPEIEFFGQSVNPASGTPTDFTSDVVYTVTADDNSTLDYTVAIIIAAKTNTAPTTEDFPVIVQQDSNNNSIDLSPHINDDDDGDVLTVSIISDFENGVVTVSGTTLIYTPTPGYNGGDTIVYTVDDGSGGNVRGAVNVTVMPANSNNQSPTAESSADVTNGDAPLTVSFTGNTSSDPDNDTLSYLWDFGDGSTSTLQNPSHVFESPITYNVILTVTDDGSPSLSDEASAITIEAGNANQFPVAVALANTTNGNAPLTVNFTGSNSSDPDSGDTLSYLWDFGDGSTSTQENPSHEFAAGTYDVVLTVTDDASQPRSNSATAIRIEAGIANRIPVAVSSADAINGNAPLTVKFTGSTSSDPDDDDLSYIWSFGDGSTSISEDPTHEFSAPGTYEVVLTVTDNGIPVLSNAATAITIEVDQANQIPIARALADITSGVGPLTVKFTGSTSSDPDDDSLSYFWDFGDGGTSTSDDPTHKFSAADTYNVVLTVTDDGNPVRSNSVSLSIEVDPNIAPLAVDDNFSVDEAGNLNRLILTNDTDDENNDLTVNWVGGSAANVGQAVGGSDGGLFTIAAGGGLNFNTNNDFDGLNDGETQTTTIQYRITDGNSNSNTATVTVTVTGVSPINNAPTADIQSDIVNGTTPLEVNFNGEGSFDSDGSIASYSWTFGENEVASNSPNPTYNYINPGEFTVTLVVTDDDGATDSTSVTITVVNAPANNVPTAVINSNVTNGTTPLSVEFNGEDSFDNDGSIVSYAWTFGETNDISTSSTPIYEYVTPGDFIVTLTVKDNDGATNSTTMTVNVENAPVNNAPTAVINSNVTNGTTPLSVEFNGENSFDNDGSIVSYAWTFGETNDISTSSTPIYEYVSPGDYIVTLTVKDNDGATNSTTMTVNVENAPVNIAPTANAGPNQNITLPTNSVTLDGSDSEDLDGSIKSYKWTKVGGTGTINSPNSVSTSVTGLTNVGSYTFILTVTDNENAESSDLVIVTVSDPVVPKATWNGSQNVSIGQPSVSGTVTISGGPMTFIFGIGSSGPESGIITFIINGKSYTASISGGGSNERITESFPPGTYNYSLTLSGSGNYSGGVNAQGSP